MAPVRIGLVGLGFGAEFIPIYQRHPDSELVAICQRNEEAVEKIGDAFGVDRRYYDDQHEHLSFTQRSGHGGSHPHLAHEFLRSIFEGRPAAVGRSQLGELDVGGHLRARLGHARWRTRAHSRFLAAAPAVAPGAGPWP